MLGGNLGIGGGSGADLVVVDNSMRLEGSLTGFTTSSAPAQPTSAASAKLGSASAATSSNSKFSPAAATTPSISTVT